MNTRLLGVPVLMVGLGCSDGTSTASSGSGGLGGAGVGAAGGGVGAGPSGGAAGLGGVSGQAAGGVSQAGAGAGGVDGGAAGGGTAGSGGAGAAGTAGSGGLGAGGTGGTGGGGGTVTDPGIEGDGDYTIGPNYTDSPDLDMQNVPRGTLYDFTMSSTDSTIYRGDDSTLLPQNQHDFTRGIRVYVPAQYVDGTPAPFMIVQDGFVGDIQRALDNLIASTTVGRQLPPIVAIFVDNGGGDSKGSQRGLEYDTVSDRYTRFIESEVLPAVLSNSEILNDHPNFALTSDPEGRGAYGCSSGGAAAFTMGWFSPDLYRRIITYSGTFVDQQDDDAAEEATYPLGAWDYHDRLIAEADAKPLRVFLHVSENDNGAGTAESTYHNWVMANERMAAELAAKGYHYRFLYALGAGHCDAGVRRETLPDTLLWMWRGYPLN